MFAWLWRRLGFIGQETAEQEATYGYSKQAIADWLRWNPQLAAEHEAVELRAKNRRDEKAGKRGLR